MLLALDVGNTNIYSGVFDRERLVCSSRVHTAHWRTSDEWAVTFSDILALHNLSSKSITGSIISSVANPVTAELSLGLELLLKNPPIIIGPGVKTGLDIKIDNPAQLGSDMVCNAVAALSYVSGDAVIFDMGTATTMSVLDQDGRFVGGAIMPGLSASLEALSSKTAMLPRISLTPPTKFIGTNTTECMRSGAVYGWASMIDGMAEKTEIEEGRSFTFFATGGHSKIIVPHMKKRVQHMPNLLLEGLRIIYHKNVG